MRWIRPSGGAPSLSGKDPVGHIHFLREPRPDVYGAAAVFLEPVDYLNLRLTGLARASFDSITMHWVTDNRAINAVAYHEACSTWPASTGPSSPNCCPPARWWAGAPAAAAELGLFAGTAVVTGTGDLHSAAVGSGRWRDLEAHLYIGTSRGSAATCPTRRRDRHQHRLPAVGAPRPLPGGRRARTAGACLTWLRDQVLYPARRPGGAAPPDVFARLNDVAAGGAGRGQRRPFTPWLNGERSPVDDHTVRGGFHNLSLSTTRADLVRAVFEGVALNSRWLLGAVEKFVGSPSPAWPSWAGGPTPTCGPSCTPT